MYPFVCRVPYITCLNLLHTSLHALLLILLYREKHEKPVLSLWTELSIWTPWTVSSARTITSLKSCYLPGFLKPGYGKENKKRQYGSIHIVLLKNVHESSKDKYSLTHIVLSSILYKFPSKARVLFLFQASFEKLESGTIRVDPHTVLLEKFGQLL